MKYIKSFEFYTPIKINNAKPFKIKNNIDKSVKYLQKGIKSDKKRLVKQTDIKKRSDLNTNLNSKIQKLKDLTFKKVKQQEYLRNNPITENVENEDSENLINIISSPDFKPEDIEKYIGLDKKDYKFDQDYYHDYTYTKDGFSILINASKLEELMNIESGVLNYLNSFGGYGGNNYEYYVNDDELGYLSGYLTPEILKKIKELSIIFNHEIDPDEEGEISELFNYLSLNKILDDFKSEISMENERAVDLAAKALIKSLPFNFDNKWNTDFDSELYFDYDDMLEYMKKHNMEVKTIKEFLENVYESNDFSYDFEYEDKQQYLGDFKDLKREVENIVDKYLDAPEDIFPVLIENNNLDVFKDRIELAMFTYNFDIHINYNRKQLNLFEIAKEYDNDILKWFKTYEFQEKIINKSEVTIYKELKNSGIINPKIEKEYEYLVDSGNYNL